MGITLVLNLVRFMVINKYYGTKGFLGLIISIYFKSLYIVDIMHINKSKPLEGILNLYNKIYIYLYIERLNIYHKMIIH
jgi:hypothetical protein